MLLASTPDGSQRIPLEGIDAVVVLGGAQITTQALDACVRRGVRVAALHMGGTVRFVVNDATGGNVHLRTALFRTATDEVRSLELAKAIVAAKLQNSRKVVDRWSRDETDAAAGKRLAVRGEQIRLRIGRLAKADTADHVRGIEGDGARIYFRAAGQAVVSSGLEFRRRGGGRSCRPQLAAGESAIRRTGRSHRPQPESRTRSALGALTILRTPGDSSLIAVFNSSARLCIASRVSPGFAPRPSLSAARRSPPPCGSATSPASSLRPVRGPLSRGPVPS